MSSQRVRVRFISRSPQYAVTDAPIAVPTKLARHGLSEVVNHLLASTVPVPFDFLVDNQLLRGSLAKFIAANNISTEDIVHIEYLPAVVLSDETKSSEMDAWIGSLDTHMSDSLICGCYDGQVRVCDTKQDFSLVGAQQCHSAPIRDVISWDNGTGGQMLATASKDQSVRVWEVTNNSKKKTATSLSFAHLATLTGHFNSVECLDIYGEEPTLISGDWNGSVLGFNGSLFSNDGGAVEEDEGSGKRKKRKDLSGNAARAEVNKVAPFFSLKAHSQTVSGVQACRDSGDSRSAARSMYTCSYDHSLKLWDIESQNCVNTSMGPKVCTSLDYSRAANAVATSHPDGRVRLWDSRTRESISTFEAYGSTDQWISQVKWFPNNNVLFAAIDYAGHVSLWDIRAKIPLSNRAAHEGKALCVDWVAVDEESSKNSSGQHHYQVVSGGSDCAIKASVIESN
jgi:ribosome biogenesis protein YTM1